MRIGSIVWKAVSPLVGIVLGHRLMVGYIYAVNSITWNNSYLSTCDLALAGLLAIGVLSSLLTHSWPKSRDLLILTLVGIILAGLSAFATSEIYGIIAG